ncbi:MAG: Tex-like N-terminal domain-containing protein, partial [Ruminococcus sp.]
MNINLKIAEELKLRPEQVDRTVELLDDGKTIPFIARYRKEVTGSLDDQVIRELDTRLQYLRKLEARKEEIISAIEAQGKLTEELSENIQNAETLVEAEDLYLPYRPKRKTRASAAIAKGLEPLARIIMEQNPDTDPQKEAESFINEELEVNSTDEAIQGAMDILAEEMANNADLRKQMRRFTQLSGTIFSKATDPEADTPYQMYYDYSEPVEKLVGHRILALDRGEREGALKVSISLPEGKGEAVIVRKFTKNDSPSGQIVKAAAEDAFTRLLFPAVEREVRRELTETAAEAAIKVFASNLRQLLMGAPLKNRTVLGVDPGYR